MRESGTTGWVSQSRATDESLGSPVNSHAPEQNTTDQVAGSALPGFGSSRAQGLPVEWVARTASGPPANGVQTPGGRVYTRAPKRARWFFVYLGACPVCGKDKGSREARYTPRPRRWADRHAYLSDSLTYDYCNAF